MSLSKSIICFALLLSVKSIYAQRFKNLTQALDRFKIAYEKPKDYKEIDTNLLLVGRYGYRGRSYFALKSKTSDIMIYVIFDGPIDSTAKPFKSLDGRIYDVNTNYIGNDTLYTTFPKQVSREIYNADVSGQSDLTPNSVVHTMSPDEKCRMIFIHKQNLVDIDLYYFYTPESEHLLAEQLEMTKGMFRFKE